MSSSTSLTPNPDSMSTQTPESHPGPRLIPSALFFTAICPVPVGIRARDMSAMVQGLVEEHAPLPIEQTSWGFILDNKSRKESHFLYYAAPRDLVFNSTAEANDSNPNSVIPSLVATTGLQFKRDTWLCLWEPECLSLIHFAAGSTTPDQVHSQFHPHDQAEVSITADALRSKLLSDYVNTAEDTIIDGYIRIESATQNQRKGIQFKLSQSNSVNGTWAPWKQTTLSQPTRLIAADLRTKESLSNRRLRKQSGKRIGIVIALFVLTAMVLGIFEYLQIKQQTKAQELTELATTQEPLVDQLKEIETMTKSLKSIFQQEFSPFRWLMAINEARPVTLSISSYALDKEGTLTANGEASEVKALNSYVDALEADPRLKSVTIVNLNTNNEGVTFSLRMETGDLHAEPSLVPAPIAAESEEADQATAAPPADSTMTPPEGPQS
ncbi:hypothetical protein QEH59_04670 [Coraliomargarita sp. SDUM461004]|uniref:PilN domain-containing protein n=1 Tax=Thalassobacterium sedimentorum TaxID=3041258 RepID=A0ABU1AJB3_9BACT|nr:hypothetical protein [Coraliomargarita sp. SDUM461004]MDQ8193703.1 hypothetical protein [Coraliomargarita sp. SDUM461004]